MNKQLRSPYHPPGLHSGPASLILMAFKLKTKVHHYSVAKKKQRHCITTAFRVALKDSREGRSS